jgi:hypothetical protein
MKLAQKRRRVITSRNGAAVAHKIVMNGKMFSLLSSQLYKHKHEAVVREICCNARDAHVAAGIPDRPFSVTLPGPLDPHFVVRDYGAGLDPDQVQDHFSALGASDRQKETSNEFTGAFGLGAHAPFTVTDLFLLTTWCAGLRYDYQIYLGADRIPMTDCTGVVEEDVPDGTEVRVPAKREDFDDFLEAARRVLPYFRTPPQCSEAIAPPTYKLRGDGFGIGKDLPHRDTSAVIMGDVAYPIDGSALYDNWSSYAVYSPEQGLLKYGIDLYVPIGAVDVTPDREGLAYEKRTIALVRDRLAAAVADAAARMTADIQEAPGLWEAAIRFNENDEIKMIFGDKITVTWQDIPVTGKVEFGRQDWLWYPPVMPESLPRVAARVLGYRDRSRSSRRGRYHSSGQIWDASETAIEVRATRDLKGIFVKDVETGHLAAAQRYMEKAGWKYALMFDAQDLADGTLVARMGWEGLLVPVSSIPKPSPVPRAVRAREERTRLRRWQGSLFENADVNLRDEAVYVRTLRDRVWRPPGQRRGSDGDHGKEYQPPKVLRPIVAAVRAISGGQVPEIYGVTPGELPRLRKAGGWTDFDTWVEAAIRAAVPRLQAQARLAQTAEPDGNHLSVTRAYLFAADSPYTTFRRLDAARDVASNDPEVQAFIDLVERYGCDIDISPDPEYVAAAARMKQAYPLIDDRYFHDDDRIAVVKYIRLIDSNHDDQ